MIDKLQFDYRRNDTERVRAVTTIGAPGTHCLSGHPDKLKFEILKMKFNSIIYYFFQNR